MALVAFLRGVNVGGHRTFCPSLLARALSKYDVVNVGAAGTFVVRKPGSRAKFRADLLRRLPFEAGVVLCDGRDLIGFEKEDPFEAEPACAGVDSSAGAVLDRWMTTGTDFSISLLARWPDMDFNQHMRNAAFLGASEDCRMRFLSENGFTMDEFMRRKIGPVVLEDRIVYRKELKLLEPFRVDMELGAMTRDGRRMKVRNSIFREPDGALAATVESVVMWLDLRERQPVPPPDDLKAAWMSLRRADDFSWYE